MSSVTWPTWSRMAPHCLNSLRWLSRSVPAPLPVVLPARFLRAVQHNRYAQRRSMAMQPQATGAVGQVTEGEGREPEHTHPPRTHTHDHYYVSHHHTNYPLNEWKHR